MTAEPRVDAWLAETEARIDAIAAKADALLADLTRVIDVEAGLRDVLDRPRPGGAP